jgi:hypothetical protein
MSCQIATESVQKIWSTLTTQEKAVAKLVSMLLDADPEKRFSADEFVKQSDKIVVVKKRASPIAN